MSDISGGSEGDRVEQAQEVDGTVTDLAGEIGPELSPIPADRSVVDPETDLEANPADVAEQRDEVPVTDEVLHDTEVAAEHPE